MKDKKDFLENHWLIHMIETFICLLCCDPTFFHCLGAKGHPDPSNANCLVLKNNKIKNNVIQSWRRDINLLKIIAFSLSPQGESGIISLWHCT